VAVGTRAAYDAVAGQYDRQFGVEPFGRGTARSLRLGSVAMTKNRHVAVPVL
jgi:hypothetical protein